MLMNVYENSKESTTRQKKSCLFFWVGTMVVNQSETRPIQPIKRSAQPTPFEPPSLLCLNDHYNRNTHTKRERTSQHCP